MPNLQPPHSQIEGPTVFLFLSCPEKVKEEGGRHCLITLLWEVSWHYVDRNRSSSRGNCLAGTAHGTNGFCSTSTQNPCCHVSPWLSSSWVTFHSKGHRDQKKRFFSGSQPATFRSGSQGIRRTYFPASSGGLESLARMAMPCSLLLVLFSEYSFFKHFLISRSRSLQ